MRTKLSYTQHSILSTRKSVENTLLHASFVLSCEQEWKYYTPILMLLFHLQGRIRRKPLIHTLPFRLRGRMRPGHSHPYFLDACTRKHAKQPLSYALSDSICGRRNKPEHSHTQPSIASVKENLDRSSYTHPTIPVVRQNESYKNTPPTHTLRFHL
jgi:hypothetical protein